ncbi:anti-anti-sigma factor [Thermomonospora echinospora]|uniref:Anti-anti-sigma factor n=1 Tax=Thermomonospora echinospora TaxID=1992 RepID=A0A1H5VSN1_9ACTN|nr:MEDS domain-containing protein [Thermomonospora echinospora]SEF90309.1 anti-anti-sigma factor [Thermomonospora echinospora]
MSSIPRGDDPPRRGRLLRLLRRPAGPQDGPSHRLAGPAADLPAGLSADPPAGLDGGGPRPPGDLSDEADRIPHKPVGAMVFGDHLSLSYNSDEERRAVLTDYVRDGLRADHKIIYMSDDRPAPAVLAWLRDAPGAAGLDLAGAMAGGRFVVRTAEEAYMATGRFDPDEIISLVATEIELALTQGYRGVRVTGEETFCLRGWPGTERFAEFERKIDQVFRTSRVNAMAICQYDRRWFDGPRLRRLESHHMGRVRVNDCFDDGTLRITPTFTPPGLRLAGAIDESTFPAVQEALRAAGGTAGHLCLDLSRLEFCDMAGLRALVGARRSGNGMDRQVILREVPDHLALMLRIAGWDSLPGVYVEEGTR